MDSSNRVALLTEGLHFNLAGISVEERVEILLYWLERLKSYLKYLPVFRPVLERVKLEPTERRIREVPNQVLIGGGFANLKFKVAFVGRLRYDVTFPEGKGPHYGRGLTRNPRKVIEHNLLFSDEGCFLVEEIVYELSDLPDRRDQEVVFSYRFVEADRSRLVFWEKEESFFQKAIWFLMRALKTTGEQKIAHGQMLLAREEEMATRFRSIGLA